MPHSVIDIEVNDESFKRFHELFKEYQEQLGEQPDAWSKVGEAVEGVGAGFAGMTAALLAQRQLFKEEEDALKKQIKQQKQLLDQEKQRSREQMKIWDTTKKITKEMAATTADLFKFIGGSAVLGGILGGGALFLGLDKLAHAASDQRRSAQGLGVLPSQQQAFRLNYQPYVDADTLLSNVAEARNDLTGQVGFQRLGIRDWQNKDSAQLSIDVAERARQLWLAHPEGRTKQYADATGISQFMSMEEWRRVGGLPAGELESARGGYQADERALHVSDADLRAQQKFSVALSKASQEIENTFIEALAPLAPDLEDLANSIKDTIHEFFADKENQKAIHQLMHSLGDGIRWLADKIKSQAFRDGMAEFIRDIPIVAKKLHDLLVMLGVIPSGPPTKAPPTPQDDLWNTLSHPANWLNPLAGAGKVWGSGLKQGFDNVASAGDMLADVFGGKSDGPSASKGGGPVFASGQGYNDIVRGIFGAESNFGRNVGPSPKGAQGNYQLMPGTAHDLGVNPNDPKQAEMGARRYLAQLLQTFGGDMRKAVAAYNWGPGNLQRDIKQRGNDWERGLPRETQDYLRKVFAIAARSSQQVTVVVSNQAGANVSTSARQLVQ